MILVKILQRKTGETVGLVTSGHAGYDVKGRDLVCCAVSTLVINLVNSVGELTEDGFDCRIKDEETIYLKMRELSPASKILIASCILGLKRIRKEYGKKYIKISKKEVQ